MGAAMDVSNLTRALRESNDESIEWMVHPGRVDLTFGDEFNRSPDREAELAFLLSRDMLDCVNQFGYKLGGWEDL